MNEFIPSLSWTNLLIIPSLLIGYTVHELGHALTAYFLGDYSQVERGKITLNPFQHLSWFGSLVFILFGVGWPKPVQANPLNFKRRYLDMFFVAISGPLTSLTFSLIVLLLTLSMASILVYVSGATTDEVFLLLFPITSHLPETMDTHAWSIAFTGYIVTTSFWLTVISLLPLPGLDGFAAIISLVAFFRERKKIDNLSYQTEPATDYSLPPLINQYKLRNNAADIHFKVGVEYHEKTQYDDAIARYRQAIRNDENFGPAYINMGLAYLGKGERQKAIQAYRGALGYADDQRSQTEAWRQLHLLSEVNPIDKESAQTNMAEMGASPWVDTKPRPNWLNLGILSGIMLIGGIVLYGYLLTELMALLRT